MFTSDTHLLVPAAARFVGGWFFEGGGGGADSHRGGTEGVMCRSYSHNF